MCRRAAATATGSSQLASCHDRDACDNVDRLIVTGIRPPPACLSLLTPSRPPPQLSQVLSGPASSRHDSRHDDQSQERSHGEDTARSAASHVEKDLIRELWFIEHGIEEKQKENRLVSHGGRRGEISYRIVSYRRLYRISCRITTLQRIFMANVNWLSGCRGVFFFKLLEFMFILK